MKYIFVVVLVFALSGVLVFSLVFRQVSLQDFGSDLMLYVVPALFLFPFIVGIAGLFLIASHRGAFGYRPLMDDGEQVDPIYHAAIGLMIAILQDFSRGMVAEGSLYQTDMRKMLEAELREYRVFFDRGYRLHFVFHHEQTYHLNIIHIITSNDIVVEVDGLFDYYFERNGERRLVPHLGDARPPFVNTPALVRLRLHRESEQMPWKLAGFEENLRNQHIGLPVR